MSAPVPRAAVVEAARACLSTPWQHLGRTRWGLDCLGLVVVVGCGLGLLPDGIDETYGPVPDGVRLRAAAERWLAPRSWPPLPGDILLIAWRRFPMHAGIVGDGPGYPTLIHAFATAGRVIEHRLDLPWRGDDRTPRVTDIYGYKGVA